MKRLITILLTLFLSTVSSAEIFGKNSLEILKAEKQNHLPLTISWSVPLQQISNYEFQLCSSNEKCAQAFSVKCSDKLECSAHGPTGGERTKYRLLVNTIDGTKLQFTFIDMGKMYSQKLTLKVRAKKDQKTSAWLSLK